MTKIFSDDIVLLTNKISGLLLDMAKDNGILTSNWDESTVEEKAKYREFLKILFIMPAILTEKGIAAFNMGDLELAYRMFEQAVSLDNELNDYWQSYFCKGFMELMREQKEQAQETFSKLKLKNSLFKEQIGNIWVRMTDVVTDKTKDNLKIFLETV